MCGRETQGASVRYDTGGFLKTASTKHTMYWSSREIAVVFLTHPIGVQFEWGAYRADLHGVRRVDL